MLLKKRLDHKVPFPEPMQKSRDFRPLFASVTILLLLGFVSILNHVENLTLTGGAVQTISFIKAGSELEFEINTNGIKSATIHLTEDTKNAKIFFTNKETASQKVEGPIYSITSVSSEKELHFSALELKLKIKEQDLLNKNIAVSDLQLSIDGNPIETTFTKKEGDYLYYTATTTKLGEYIIGKKAAAVAKTVVKEEVQIPVEKQTVPTEAVEEEQVEESNALVGKAEQMPSQEQTAPVVEESFWQKIGRFFKNLFS